MKKSWIVLGIIALVVFLGITRPPEPATPDQEAPAVETSESTNPSVDKGVSSPRKKSNKPAAAPEASSSDVQSKHVGKKAVTSLPAKSATDKDQNVEAVRYILDDGLAVIQGDIVVGVPVNNSGAASGFVQVPTIELWKTREIPVYVQTNLSRPERVRQALELFNDSVIRFVPFTDQEDVLIFEEGSGVCKSYVGRVGGKQPIWIAPGCEASEIAHEILHALGFVHEQNRQDRDNFVEVFPENIEEAYKDNYEKLPASLMKVNALSEFDFESLMIYPVGMFAKPGQQAMRSRTGAAIQPSPGLSAKDKERLQKAYGHL